MVHSSYQAVAHIEQVGDTFRTKCVGLPDLERKKEFMDLDCGRTETKHDLTAIAQLSFLLEIRMGRSFPPVRVSELPTLSSRNA